MRAVLPMWRTCHAGAPSYFFRVSSRPLCTMCHMPTAGCLLRPSEPLEVGYLNQWRGVHAARPSSGQQGTRQGTPAALCIPLRGSATSATNRPQQQQQQAPNVESEGIASSPEDASCPSSTSQLPYAYKSTRKGHGVGDVSSLKKNAARRNPTIARTSSSSLPPAASAASEAPQFVSSRSSCASDSGPVPERPLTPLQRRQLAMKDKPAFILAPAALRRVKMLISQYQASSKMSRDGEAPVAGVGETPIGIRIGVRKRGCSGYSYTVTYQFATHPPRKKTDMIVEQMGVGVYVDGDALFYVIGTEMDYTITNVEEKFTFNNPNQKYSCGCQESFMPFSDDDNREG